MFGTLPLEEIVPVGSVIFKSGNFANAVKSITVSTEAGDNYADLRAASLKASGGKIISHSALADLLADTHGQYSRTDGTRAFTGTGAGFRDEDNMASNDATATASQQSVKKYTDDNVEEAIGLALALS